MGKNTEIISGVLIAKEANGTVRQVLLLQSDIFFFLNLIEMKHDHVDFFSKDYSKCMDIVYERQDDGEVTDIVFPYRQEEDVKSALKSAFYAGIKSVIDPEIPDSCFERWYEEIKMQMFTNLNIKKDEDENAESPAASVTGQSEDVKE